ncbi:MAG: hypothetical protein OEZ01_01890 [Candidatus Heimdallarchaeota archaeon]|nr:hypothetical protein [Candidatus Heimdallarchaeota archaeon]MDH5644725.1 hypothetical protein [Candidatus Heimdallarchaeota archaeon]
MKIILSVSLITLLLMTSMAEGQSLPTNISVGDEFSYTMKSFSSLKINETAYENEGEHEEKLDIEVTGINESHVEYTAINKDDVSQDTAAEYNGWVLMYLVGLLIIYFALVFFEPDSFSFEEPETSDDTVDEEDFWVPLFISTDNMTIYSEMETEMNEVTFDDLDGASDDSHVEASYDEDKSFEMEYLLEVTNSSSNWSTYVYYEFVVELDLEQSIAKYLSMNLIMEIKVGDASQRYELEMEAYEGFRLFGLNTSPLWFFVFSIISIAVFTNKKTKML